MKKLLYFMLVTLFFIQCKPEIIYNKISVGKNTNRDSVTVSYRNEEFVVSFPPDAVGAEQMRLYLLARGLHPMFVCPCSDSLQLWGGVQIIPDGSEPPQPIKPTGGNIVKNFMVVDADSAFALKVSTIPLDTSLQQPSTSTTTNEIIVAIDDSGIELSDEATRPSPFLFRNSPSSLICNSPTLRSGIYGMNVLNYLGLSSSVEPKDDDGHGTFINGIISHKARPPRSYTGPHDYIGDNGTVSLKILHARFIHDRTKQATLYDALCGVHYALNKQAKVINASWRGLANAANNDSLKKAFIPTLNAIVNANAILITGSGNDHFKNENKALVFPALFSRDPQYGSHVIAVGAWDLERGTIADFSNQGSYVDIYAPGVGITSTGLRNRPSLGKGTSYATPYVSRVAALLLGNRVPINDLKNRIIRNVSGTRESSTLKMLDHTKAIRNTVTETPTSISR